MKNPEQQPVGVAYKQPSTSICAFALGVLFVLTTAAPSTGAQRLKNAPVARNSVCDPTPAGIVAWWPAEGNANDIIGGNNGTLIGGTGFAPGEVGQAFSLDGISTYVDAGNNYGLRLSSGDFTVDAWVLFDALRHPPGQNQCGAPQGDMSIVDKMSETSCVYNVDGWRLLKQDDDHFWFCFGAGSNGCGNGAPTTVRSNTVAQVGLWYHVAGVKSSTGFSIYVNGVLENSIPLSPFTDTNSVDLLIGANQGTLSILNGEIDEPHLFARALTDAEISAIYSAGSAGICAPSHTFSVIHNFTGGRDGAQPLAGLTTDRAGNLYGTAFRGGAGFGTLYRLKHSTGGWTFAPLYTLMGGTDGAGPTARMIFGPDGALYGTTANGGSGTCSENGYTGCGTAFILRPRPTQPRSVLDPWIENVIYRFSGGNDGGLPHSEVVFDPAGNFYGTAELGGTSESGVVYELMRSGGSWNQTVLYSFLSSPDGAFPFGALVLAQNGNLYSTTSGGGTNGAGTVFQLIPAGSAWMENILRNLSPSADGSVPYAGLITDASGSLYGVAAATGPQSGGTAFRLTSSGGNWSYDVLQSFIGSSLTGPYAGLTMDSAGNLYGTTFSDNLGYGSVFELTSVNGGWAYTLLHAFSGGGDGGNPQSSVLIDASGNLYGTAATGGTSANGVVWEIRPQ